MSEHCPTLGGLSEDGFNPEFDLKQLVLNPSSSMHIWGWLASGLLVLITVTIASHTINEHLHHYFTPEIQRHKVRVVAYPAAYSILAWLSYLKYDYETPFRIQNEGMKESVTTKIFGFYKFKLKSKWGLHFRVITDILVLQFPIWNIIAAFISIFTQIKGVYCDGQFDFHGAYIYLATIQFISLSIILMALFTYLAVFDPEWKQGHIRAHGMFWCVKAPIMIIFYCGDILLMILSYFKVIQDKPATTPGGTYWTAAAIKNGYYVLIICVCMAVVAVLMQIYFGLDEEEQTDEEDPDCGYWEALVDGFLAYIPQFMRNVFSCGGDTVVLAKKRRGLKKNKNSDKRRLSEDELNLLAADEDNHHLSLHDTNTSLYEYLTQPLPALYNKRMDDMENGDARQQSYNYNALPLQPLSNGMYASEKNEGSNDDYMPAEMKREEGDFPPKNKRETMRQEEEYPMITMPPAPLQSRVLNHNDEITSAAQQHTTHFTPHDLERK
ncbi:hypothetical protein BDF20DRAFT_814732 [Mycotypha africana]|uniref:uncharacterized protein n=1 Tax=Mycotypha africana TaxID=64632 RepID=UPI0023004F2F|nr:uncharacterized protein BDF20DRAFT_814732 [Mycotypha africana]KAI8987948.1 hypothetical protein BDF20DRAFT_814732 [Mycotypha africana]